MALTPGKNATPPFAEGIGSAGSAHPKAARRWQTNLSAEVGSGNLVAGVRFLHATKMHHSTAISL